MKLQNLINPKLVLDVIKNSVTLEEKKNITTYEEEKLSKKMTLQNVTICDLPDEIFAFSLDNDDYENQFLDNSREYINSKCDGVIVHYNNNKIEVVFCELKSGRLTPDKYESQLINSKLFVSYLVSLFNQFYKGTIEFGKIRYVVFYRGKERQGQIDKSLRRKVRIFKVPIPESENMQNYVTEKIIKYPLFKTHQNYIEWQEFLNKSK